MMGVKVRSADGGRRPMAQGVPRRLWLMQCAVLVLLHGLVAVAQAAPLFHKVLRVNYGQVTGGPLTNFPLLFSSTDPALRTTANGGRVTNANGWDIIFATTPTCADSTTCGGNKLDHEIESYNAVTGQLIAWVRVPSLDNGTVLYVHYSDSLVVATTENRPGLWNSGYKGVWHLRETPAGAAGEMKDSTSNANNGTGTWPRTFRPRPGDRSTAAWPSTARSTAVLDGCLVPWWDRLAHECRKARLPPCLQLGHEELGNGVAFQEAIEEVLAKQDHQPLAIPFIEWVEDAVGREGSRGREDVAVGMPLDQVASGRHTGHHARPDALSEGFLHEGTNRRCRGVPQLDQQLAPAAEERTQQPRDGEDDVTVRNRGEQLLPQPLRPQQGALLFARGAEGAGTA